MSCEPTPTQTLFETVTSESLSTSFSSSVTTLPDSTSTILITTCLSSSTATGTDTADGGGGCASSTVLTSTTVIDGGVSTVQVPVTVTLDIPQTIATATLFSSCTSQTTSHETSRNSPPTPPNPPPSSDSQTSTFLTASTPTTTFTSAFSTTLPNGDVIGTTATVTSTLPPTSVLVTTTAPARETQQGGSGGGSSGTSNLGPILGGTLGGFFGLLAIGALLWFFCRRKPRWDDIFEKEDFLFEDPDLVRSSRGRSNFDISGDSPADVDPKPYHYGLVGGTRSPNSEYAGVPLHERRSSETPLMSQHNASAGRLSANASGSKRTSYPSRPSTSGSLYPVAGPSSHGHGQLVMNNNLPAIPPGAAPPVRATPSPADDLSQTVLVPSSSTPAAAPLIPLSPSTPPRPHATSVDATGSPTTIPGILPERRMLFVANQDPGSPTSTSFSLVDATAHDNSTTSSPTTPSPGPSSLGFVPYPSAISEKQRLRTRDSVLSATSIASQMSVQTLSHPVLTPTQAVFAANPASTQGPTPGSPTSTARAASPEGIPQLPPIRSSSPVLAYLVDDPTSPSTISPVPLPPTRSESSNSQNTIDPPPPAYTD